MLELPPCLDFAALKFEDCLDLPVSVSFVDTKGTILECNEKQALDVSYQKITDLVGLNIYELIDQPSVPCVKEVEKKILTTGKPTLQIEKVNFNISPHNEFIFLILKFPFYGQATKKMVGTWGFSFKINKPTFPFEMPFPSSLTPNNYMLNNHKKNVSKRENECIHYLVQGLTSKQIAKKLMLSPRTIEFYIHRLKIKFGCLRTTELIGKLFSSV